MIGCIRIDRDGKLILNLISESQRMRTQARFIVELVQVPRFARSLDSELLRNAVNGAPRCRIRLQIFFQIL